MDDHDEIVVDSDYEVEELDFDLGEALNKSPEIRTIYFAADLTNQHTGIVFETEEGDIYPMVLSLEVLQHLRRQLDKILAERDSSMLESMWKEE